MRCCLFITLSLVIVVAIASMFTPFEVSDSMREAVCALYCLGAIVGAWAISKATYSFFGVVFFILFMSAW